MVSWLLLRLIHKNNADWNRTDVKHHWRNNFTAFDQWRNESFNEMVSAIPEAQNDQIVWNQEVADWQIVSWYDREKVKVKLTSMS